MSFCSSASLMALVGALALLAEAGGEALDQLAGDADDHLGRAEAGHLLGFLQRDLAVVDDGRDVGDRARLHVRQALALAPDAADGRRRRPRSISKTSALANSVPDVESRARGQRIALVALEEAAPEGHQLDQSRVAVRWPSRAWLGALADASSALGSRSRRVPRAWAISGRPPPLPSITGAPDCDQRAAAETPALHEVVADGHEQLRLVRLERERDDAVAELGAHVPGEALSSFIESNGRRVGDEPACHRPTAAARPARPGGGA